MNEIRDRAEKQATLILHNQWKIPETTAGIIFRQLLKIPEMAIVDREAKLPNYIGAAIAGTLKDWVKEIK